MSADPPGPAHEPAGTPGSLPVPAWEVDDLPEPQGEPFGPGGWAVGNLGYAVDGSGDVYVRGQVPTAALDGRYLDLLVGALLEAADEPFNDLLALGALRACAELGLRVPKDLAIVGFDDIPLAALVAPALTTCRVPRHELGTRAVELLLARIREETATEQEIVLVPELVVRASAP